MSAYFRPSELTNIGPNFTFQAHCMWFRHVCRLSIVDSACTVRQCPHILSHICSLGAERTKHSHRLTWCNTISIYLRIPYTFLNKWQAPPPTSLLMLSLLNVHTQSFLKLVPTAQQLDYSGLVASMQLAQRLAELLPPELSFRIIC